MSTKADAAAAAARRARATPLATAEGATSSSTAASASPDAVGTRSNENSGAAYRALFDMSRLLNTGLHYEELRICTHLIEAGVNPEALAKVVRHLRSTAEAVKAQQQQQPMGLEPSGVGDEEV